MTQEMTLICRSCKIAADGEIIDDQVVSITCPSCGVRLEGDAARKAYLEQARYYALKEAQDSIKEGVGKSRAVTYKPGRIQEPDGPFTLKYPNL